MTVFLRLPAAMISVTMAFASPSTAEERRPPLPVQNDPLSELDRRADDLSEAARETIEEFVNLVGPMLTRLSRLIDDLPVYETPEILPNGDIIIRRKRDAPAPAEQGDDLTET